MTNARGRRDSYVNAEPLRRKDELVPQYPRLPANSPWSGDPVPSELPLGFSVDEIPDMTSVATPVASPSAVESHMAGDDTVHESSPAAPPAPVLISLEAAEAQTGAAGDEAATMSPAAPSSSGDTTPHGISTVSDLKKE